MLDFCDHVLTTHSDTDDEVEAEGSSDGESEYQAGPSKGGATRECSARASSVVSDDSREYAAPFIRKKFCC